MVRLFFRGGTCTCADGAATVSFGGGSFGDGGLAEITGVVGGFSEGGGVGVGGDACSVSIATSCTGCGSGTVSVVVHSGELGQELRGEIGGVGGMGGRSAGVSFST